MRYSIEEKKKIFEDIRENGYSVLKNLYSENQLNTIKNSLVSILNYIKPDNTVKDLQEKYYQVKEYSIKLKGHFYDMLPYELETLQLLHRPEIIDLVKEFFNTDVIFSGRPAIHIHDSENERYLLPHQETNQFSKDFLFIWSPLYDAKGDQGGLTIYKDSHKNGYHTHNANNKLKSAQVKADILKQFKSQTIEVDAGSALMIHSAMIHETVQTNKKRFARFVITDRYCPLKKLPFLKKENAPIKIPYPYGDINYNIIED